MNNNENNGIIRRPKGEGFTIIKNKVLFDSRLSLKAKGLYATIQLIINLPNYIPRKKTLVKMNKDGIKAFNSAWNELKNEGYLKIHVYRLDRGFRYEYEILNKKKNGPGIPHTYYYDTKGHLSYTNIDKERYSYAEINGNISII